MRRMAFRLSLSLAALLLGLGAAEAALRLGRVHPAVTRRPVVVDREGRPFTRDDQRLLYARADPNPYIEYVLRPHTLAYFQYDLRAGRPPGADDRGRIPIRINRYGLRDVDFPERPAPGVHRILCLGDSFTFGYGVPLEATYPKQLERELRRRWPGRAFQVVNAGFAAGKAIPNHVAYLMTRGIRLHPRTALLTVCLNDLGDVPMTVTGLVRLELPGADTFYLVRLLRNALVGWRARRLAADPDGLFRRLYPGSVSEQEWQTALEAAREFARVKGLHLLVVVYPMLDHLDGSYPWVRFHERLRRFCRRHDLELEDLLPAFRGRNARELWVHPADQHPNGRAHAIAARALAAALARRRWVP